MMNAFIRILFYCLFWGSCMAQLPQDFLFHYIDNENQNNGLSQLTNHFIYKDSKGFVWISSLSGLNRFDGNHVKIYEEIIGDSSSLQGQFVQGKFSEDAHSNLWFTTYSALHFYNRKNDNFQHFTIKDSTDLSVPGFYNCGMDAAGRLWIIHQDALYLFDTQSRAFLQSISLGSSFYRGEISQDTKGQVTDFYAYSPGKVDLLRLSNPMSDAMAKNHYFLNEAESITSILVEQDSMIWIASSKGLALFNPLTKNYQGFVDDQVPTYDKLLGMALYDTQYIALSSLERGLIFFDKISRQFEVQSGDAVATSSRGPIYKSNDGGLWLSIEGQGVAYTYPEEIKFKKYQEKKRSFNKLLDAGNGEIWAATFFNGIFILDESKNILRHISHASHPAMHSDKLIYLFKDDQKRIWILSWKGISYYHLETKEFKSISKDHIFLYGHQSSNGKIQLCSYSQNGIWEVDDDFQLRRIDPSSNAKYTFLYEDKDQKLYAARDLTTLAIFTQDSILKPFKEIPLRGIFKAAYEDAGIDSLIWFATTSGLVKLHKNTHQLEVYSRKDGLPSSTIYSIVADANGLFWLSTNRGISCFNPQNLEAQNYGLMEGISALEFNSFSYLQRPSGEIWFGSTNGLTTFQPELIFESSPPSVQITGIRVNNEVLRGLRCQQTQATNPGEIKSIQLSYPQNTLGFSFTALEYAHPENIRLQYRMKGMDEHWMNTNREGFIRYPKLRPGNYSFQIRAATSLNAWSPIKQIKIRIQPPFYYTWWFVLLSCTSVVFITYLIFQFREKQKNKIRQELEKQRNEFAQDMHDELGSSISSLKLSIEFLIRKVSSREIKQNLEKIADTSQTLYQKLREVIWAVNSRYDTLENLILYLHRYASEYLENTKIEYRSDIPTNIPQHVILGKQRSNILFSFKEAINNIVQHAEASHISIDFIVHPHTFHIQIRDNGKGIPQAFLEKSPGTGLENMQQRFREIGGICKIEPNEEGTTISFYTKIK
ncbi:MAG: two-component regulator propeller domain-containing protein [Bacteroidota bacterium]